MLGIPATIVMPSNAPATKLENTRALGAEVVLYDRFTEDREQIARKIVVDRGATLVPAYDDAQVVAGQGTVGLELMQQAAELGLKPDQVLVPTSGGGLTAGTAIAVRGIAPEAVVYGVEPEAFDDTRRSLAAGTLLTNPPEARSICDALQSSPPGKITFAINRQLLAGILTASDAEVETAMAMAFRHLRLVVEPGGAVALAAALAGRIALAGRTTAIVLSGGNVDAATFIAALSRRVSSRNSTFPSSSEYHAPVTTSPSVAIRPSMIAEPCRSCLTEARTLAVMAACSSASAPSALWRVMSSSTPGRMRSTMARRFGDWFVVGR
jgi:threonine dehydratase